jgi:hypothetical protein
MEAAGIIGSLFAWLLWHEAGEQVCNGHGRLALHPQTAACSDLPARLLGEPRRGYGGSYGVLNRMFARRIGRFVVKHWASQL